VLGLVFQSVVIMTTTAIAQTGPVSGGTVSEPVEGLSTIKPLRQLAKESVPSPATNIVEEGLGGDAGGSSASSAPSEPDPVQQTTEAPGDAAQELSDPLVNFQAQNGGDPPDTVGDVGPSHYVQMVNVTIAVYDKQGVIDPAFSPPPNISSLWAGQPDAQAACRDGDAGDPIVLYDQEIDRWMVSQFTDGDPTTNGLQPQADGTWAMCIAYSQTGDPTGNWFLYQFPLPRQHDYMKYGIWPDGLYMSTFEGNTLGVYVFERDQMVSGSPARFIDGGSITDGSGVDGRGNRILPADWDGVTEPPVGSPNYFVQSIDAETGDGGADRLEVYEATTDFDAATPTMTFTLAHTLPTAPFDTNVNCTPNFRACINQAGTTNKVDALSNRLMHRLQYRNFGDHESMVVSQTVDGDGANRAGVRWYELRQDPDAATPAWEIYQQGTYAPVDNIERWMSSAAMDSKGNIALGYSASAGDPGGISPDIRYTGRMVEDPLGSMTQGEHLMLPATVTTNSLTGSNRWGDYSSMNVDPVDDCTFWYTQMYIGAGQARSTQVASFRFPSCANVNLQLEKDAPEEVAAGEKLPYTIEVTNGGTDAATNVVVTDELPPGVDFDAASSSPSCTESAPGTLTCTLDTIAASQTKSLLIVVDVPPDYISSGGSPATVNTATATADQSDTNPGDNTDDATTTIVEEADLGVTKLCQPDVITPTSVSGTCRIFVDNFGPSDAQNVEVVDELVSSGPFTVSATTVEPASSGTCTVVPPGPSTTKTVTCDLDTEPADGRTTITVRIEALTGADVSDSATADSDTPDPDLDNNKASSTLSISPSADLKIEKEQTDPASGPVTAGENLLYTLTITNNGPSPATNVVVTDQLPAQTTFVNATASDGNCALDSSGSPLVCNLGTVAFGAAGQETITIEVAVPTDTPEDSVLTNAAEVRSDVADPNNADNIDQVTTAVQTVADLTLQKFAEDAPFIAGTTVTYRYELSNAGPSWSRDLSLVDQLPPGTRFVSAFLSTGGSPVSPPLPCDEVADGTNKWSCPLGDLAPTGSQPLEAIVNVFIEPDVPEGAQLTNAATATSDTNDPGSNGDTVTITVDTSADLGIVKTSDFDTYAPSATIKYTVTTTNFGPSDAQNVVVIDNLPVTKQALYRFDTANCTKSGLTLTCNLGTMPAGSTESFNVYVTVKGNKGVVDNNVSVDSKPTLSPPIDDTADPISQNNTSLWRVLIMGGISKK
jgi:uncharacterized repeat protein (TIGR01451 family)